MEGEDILYEVKDRMAIITLNVPKTLNAMTESQYLLWGKLMERANEEEDTIVTIIQSTGRYFSAGANFTGEGLTDIPASQMFEHSTWFGHFVGRNVWITDVFNNHKKVLVTSLNGPVIGLSLGLVALSDLIYAKDSKEVSILGPFAKLGLVAEGGLSATLFARLGWSKASEALLFSKSIPGADLEKIGFFNKTYDGKFKTTEEFNEEVQKEVATNIENLEDASILDLKQLLKAQRDILVNSASSNEAVRGFYKWIEGAPQMKFAELAQLKNKESKM